MKIGLALSGGGLRATFFHLGVLSYLSRSRRLPEVKIITSVSGGSIVAAHLIQNWSKYCDPATFDEAAAPLRALARADLRGRILRRLPTHFPLAWFYNLRHKRSLPARSLLFERYLSEYLFGDSTLADLRKDEPNAPALEILATNLTRGTLSCFTSEGFIADYNESIVIPAETRVDVAVATSAAFPGFFPPVQVDADSLGFPSIEFLTDGGIYDNLGIRRLGRILQQIPGIAETILICDASGYLDWEIGKEFQGLITTAVRATDILMYRIGELERELFPSSNRGTRVHILGIGDWVSRGALDFNTQIMLKFIRTDLDYFSEDETKALEAHGHEVAAEIGIAFGGDTSAGIAKEEITTKKIARRLHDARKLKLRLFSFWDPVSYFHFAVLLGVLALTTMSILSSWSRAQFLAKVDRYPSDSFGLLAFRGAAEADDFFAEVAKAARLWPDDAEVQQKVAVACYSIYNRGQVARAEADQLLAVSLATLEKYPVSKRRMRPIEIAHQLQGHHFLMKKSYVNALSAYERFLGEVYPGLYGAEFNVCNAALEAGALEKASAMCLSADLHAQQQGVALWGAKYNLGRIHLRRGEIEQAVREFREAWAIAAHKSEAERSRFKETFQKLNDFGKVCGAMKQADSGVPFCH